MSSQHVALFVTNLDIGGAQRIMRHLAKGLADKGLQVDLVLTRAGQKKYEEPDNVRVIDIGAPRIYAALPGLVWYLKKEEPQTLLSAGSAVNVIVSLAKRLSLSSARLVISEHNTLSSSIRESEDWRMKLLPTLMRQTYSLSDAVVAVSDGVATNLSQELPYPRKEIQTIYNPVVTPDLLQRSREPVENPWFKSEEPPVVLSAGRHTAQKDYSTLIRAFTKLREKRPARLVILGKGPKRRELESTVKENDLEEDVLFPGFVDNPYKYMKQANVFALSSKWEGLPTVLIEAMACGTPVVSTDCPSGPAEILEDGKWGRLVPIESPDRLSAAIQNTLDDPIDGKPRAEHFQLNRAVESYLNLLMEN